MNYEFWAEFSLYNELEQGRHEDNKTLLDTWVERGADTLRSPWDQVSDAACRQHLLAQVLPSTTKVAYGSKRRNRTAQAKEYARTGVVRDKEPSGLLYWYYGREEKGGPQIDLANPQGPFQSFLCNRLQWMAEILDLASHNQTFGAPLPDLTLFPRGSWAIQFTFTLRTPYLSRDDVDFYIIDNPVKKEHVFKVPYVAPSQWKGALRAAMMRELVFALQEGNMDEDRFMEDRLRLYRLFGNEKDGTAEFLNRAWALHRTGPRPETDDADQYNVWEQRFQAELKAISEQFEQLLRARGYRVGNVEGFQGSLSFYSTFFDRTGLEIINPHDRVRRVGKNPILFESVPAGTTGRFTLLYIPFDRTGEDEAETRKQVAEDLTLLARGLQAMFTLYGFGAKTSSGFGLAEDAIESGRLELKMPDAVFSQDKALEIEEPEEEFRKYLDDDGVVKSNFKGSGNAGLMSNSEYKKQGAQYGGGSLSEFKRFRSWYGAHGEQWQTYLQTASAETDYSSGSFGSLSQLVEMCKKPEAAGGDK